MLKDIGVELNLPPFMEGKQQVSADVVEKGCRIASVCIHIEKTIDRIKTFLKLPITLAWLSNQIVFVCSYLSDFKPILVPPSTTTTTDTDEDVDKYFEDLDKYFEDLLDDSSEDELSDISSP